MKLVRAADYAVRVLVYLARQDPETRVTRDNIIAHTGVPAAYLKRIIQTLVQSRLIAAQPGVHGGCRLALSPGEITVLKVVEIMDGPIEISECLASPGVCPRVGFCAFRRLLQRLRDDANRLLEGTTIADLAGDHPPPLCMPRTFSRCE